jgi:hypothetical protein
MLTPACACSGCDSISKDMVPFDIPVTFTIAPHDPNTDADGFLRYAQRMNGLSEAEYHTILTGVIHARVYSLLYCMKTLLARAYSAVALHDTASSAHCAVHWRLAWAAAG